MTQTADAQKRPSQRRFLLIAAAVAAGALAGLAGVYGIGGFKGNPANAACAGAVKVAHRIAPLVHGEVAAIKVADAPLALPNLSFHDANGATKTLADWRGRTVLLNLWATWCVPCRKEMPALDALEQKLGSPQFEVVAVNIDTRDPEKPKAWLGDVGIHKLAYYADPSAGVFQDLKSVGRAFGMPTTVLVDPSGCEIGTIAGPAEWASGDAITLIEAALKK
ncbi:MAG TPA: TlpA disulfide reductase family protein [Pseudolabrys sp.]|nr:TlpA disulfide reductase family protein [Pseudolabrys sp.]